MKQPTFVFSLVCIVIGKYVLPFAMKFSLSIPPPLVDFSVVNPPILPSPIYLTSDEISLVYISIQKQECSSSVRLTIFQCSLISISITPRDLSMSMAFVSKPIVILYVTICKWVCPPSMLLLCLNSPISTFPLQACQCRGPYSPRICPW